MKNILSLFAVAACLVSIQAQAVYNPMWERPIQQAAMTSYKAVGNFSNVKSAVVTLTKRDGSPAPTGIVAKLDDGRVIKMAIHTVKNGVDAVQYTAAQVFPAGTISEGGYSIRLMSVMGHMWSAALFNSAFGAQIGELDLHGQPQGVITPQ